MANSLFNRTHCIHDWQSTALLQGSRTLYFLIWPQPNKDEKPECPFKAKQIIGLKESWRMMHGRGDPSTHSIDYKVDWDSRDEKEQFLHARFMPNFAVRHIYKVKKAKYSSGALIDAQDVLAMNPPSHQEGLYKSLKECFDEDNRRRKLNFETAKIWIVRLENP